MSDRATTGTPADGSAARKPRVSTGAMLFAHLAAGLIVVVVLGVVVPKLTRIIDEFGVQVSPTTGVWIAVSNLVARWGYLLLPAGLAVDAAVLFGLGRLPPSARWLATVWGIAVLIAAVVVVGVVVAAVIVPLQDLMTQLS